MNGRNNQPPNILSSTLEKRSFGASWPLSNTAASAGDRVRELKAEITVEIAMVRANCL
ncbi:hypothetical protein D3C81_2095650 [compost metagenome]